MNVLKMLQLILSNDAKVFVANLHSWYFIISTNVVGTWYKWRCQSGISGIFGMVHVVPGSNTSGFILEPLQMVLTEWYRHCASVADGGV